MRKYNLYRFLVNHLTIRIACLCVGIMMATSTSAQKTDIVISKGQKSDTITIGKQLRILTTGATVVGNNLGVENNHIFLSHANGRIDSIPLNELKALYVIGAKSGIHPALGASLLVVTLPAMLVGIGLTGWVLSYGFAAADVLIMIPTAGVTLSNVLIPIAMSKYNRASYNMKKWTIQTQDNL